MNSPLLEHAQSWIERLSHILGHLAAVLLLLLLVNVFYDVIMRYVFNDVSIGMQELEWHLFAAAFLLGVPYALTNNAHVRVDLIYESLRPKRQALVDIFGVLVFLLPFCGLVAWYGVGFAMESYELGETSGDPGGLPYRWLIKSMISVSFIFTLIAGLGLLLKAVRILLAGPTEEVTS